MTSRFILAIVTVALLVLPVATGVISAKNTVVTAPTELYGLGFTLEQLFLPALASAVAAAYVLPLIQDRHIVNMRTRVDIVAQCRKLCIVSAAVAGALCAGAAALWGITAFYVDPVLGISSNFGQGYTPGGDPGAYTFAQLISISPAVFLVVHSIWMGLWAAGYAGATALLLLLLPQSLLALSLPLIVYWVDNIVLANLGVEEFRVATAIFPFTLAQLPLWTTVVPLMVWGAVLIVLWRVLEHRRYATGVTV